MAPLIQILKKNSCQLKSYVVFIFVCAFSFNSFSQDQHEIDSLKKVLPTLTNDSVKIQTLNALAAEVVDIDPSLSIDYAKQALKLAIAIKSKKATAKAYHNLGNGYFNIAEYKNAISVYIKALSIQEEIGNKTGILSSSGAIGNVFLELKQPDEAYKYFMRTLEISKEIGSKGGEASC